MNENPSGNSPQKMSIYVRLAILSVIVLVLAIIVSQNPLIVTKLHGIMVGGDSVKSQSDYSDCVQKAYVNEAQSISSVARVIYNKAINDCNKIPHTVGVRPN